jgi:hypothetical protein
MSNKKIKKTKTPKRPEKFRDFSECLHWIKKSVYMIVRGRKTIIDNQEAINWITLGTGFVAAPHRMITASHVINDPTKGELLQHQDGDKYYVIKHDDLDNWHFRIFEPKLNQEIFLYPDIDLGIIYLDEGFYALDGKVFMDKNDFIRISKDNYPIGSDIGVLGYPLCALQFENRDLSKPKIGDIILRADKGVINARYRKSENIANYEFTLSFNPGNSGGPIFDIKSGRLVSIVHGFRSTRINMKESILTEEELKNLALKDYKEKSFIEALHANYSMGYSSSSFVEKLKDHKILS